MFDIFVYAFGIGSTVGFGIWFLSWGLSLGIKLFKGLLSGY
jgi:hypothetical protein